MNEQIETNGISSVPPGGDPIDEIDVSNKGQRIGVILVAVLILVGVGWFLVSWSDKENQRRALDELRAEFTKEHNASYESFWTKARIDLKVMRTNADFEARIKEYLAVSSIAYARHVREKALPILEEGIPRYRALEAAGLMLPELREVTDALEQLLQAWQRFTNEVLMYEAYLANQAKLDELGGQWMAAQLNPKEQKYHVDAARYVKICNCIFGDGENKVIQIDPWDLSHRLRDTCAKGDARADWFRRVAFECLNAAGEDLTPGALFEETLSAYAKIEPENQDTKSVFAIKECLTRSRVDYEAELSDAIALAWAGYVAKRNAFLTAVDDRKKEI